MNAMKKPRNQPIGVRFDSTTWLIVSVTDSNVCPGSMTAGVRCSSAAVSGDHAPPARATCPSLSVLPPPVPRGRAGSSSVLGLRTIAR